jgi:phthiocerol/phenolphthiocerol synthesis type-I polyketide synthase E
MEQSEMGAEAIAVIGMAGRFPGATSVEALWRNLREAADGITDLSREELLAVGVPPAQVDDPLYVRSRGVLEGADRFDAELFGYTPREAAIMDPQQRLFLQCAWEALEDAGLAPSDGGPSVGVYAAASLSTYLLFNLMARPDVVESAGTLQVGIGNGLGHLATSVSYRLGLRGPSLAVQTACSSSLVAVHLACQALLTGECDVAIAGGVSLNIPQRRGYRYEEGGILSRDGRCRSYDASASGTVRGEGVGIVVLRRLSDARAGRNRVRAVIRGSAVNNDGGVKVGYTAPGVEGQAEVIRTALAVAGVKPSTVGYVEGHGSGTSLGDAVEVAALTEAFRGARRGGTALGSIKTNIGHLDAAAGIAGLIKTVLCLEHRTLPATVHFTRPNPTLRLEESPFFILGRSQPWEAGATPRRAGVSSFGMGGTNAHVVLEEAPPAPASVDTTEGAQLLVLSAGSEAALERLTDRFTTYLQRASHPQLADVAHTLQVGRRALRYRRALVCGERDEALRVLETRDRRRLLSSTVESREERTVFLFSGQGAQRAQMGAELYRSEPLFREQVDTCCEVLTPLLGVDLRGVMFAGPEHRERMGQELEQTRLAQPALFVLEYALARLWMSWGVQPAAMLGHSIGEYVAACLAGVFRLEDALALVARRGALMQSLPPGGMLSVQLGEADVARLLPPEVSVASINAPRRCVVSGPLEPLRVLEQRLLDEGVGYQRLRTSHAFHSEMMTPVLDAFAAAVAERPLKAPRLPFVSNVSGTWAGDEVTDPRYWARHLRAPVRLAEGLSLLAGGESRLFLEVGPGQSLSVLARLNAEAGWKGTAVASLPDGAEGNERMALLDALGQLWLGGARVDWETLHAGAPRACVALPTYPFESTRHWVAPAPQAQAWPEPPARPAPEPASRPVAPPAPPAAAVAPGPDSDAQTVQLITEMMQELLGVPRVGPEDNFFHLGGSSLTAVQLITRIRDTFHTHVALRNFFELPTATALARVVGAYNAGATPLSLLAEPPPAASTVTVVREDTARREAPGPAPSRKLDMSIFFFSSDASADPGAKYRLVLDAARYADQKGFTAIWTPERHFHRFGGLFPSPAVLSAGLAAITERIGIRAGSVILPRHPAAHVVEQWSVVDNLSGGRVGLALAPGFHPNDFVFCPEVFETRRERLWRDVEEVRRLWRGEPFTVDSPAGTQQLHPFPRPLQAELPVWITSSDKKQTFERAGTIGANLLTGLLAQNLEQLKEKIGAYRAAMAQHHPGRPGTVTLMVHTFVGEEMEDVRKVVKGPFTEYLRTHLDFSQPLAGRASLDPSRLTHDDGAALLDFAFERYFNTSALMGTRSSCAQMLSRLVDAGVDEVACLIDFGVDNETVYRGLENLHALWMDFERRMAGPGR